MFYGEREFINFIKNNARNIRFVCIGDSSVIEDSIGPIMGSELKRIGLNVIGDCANNINSENIKNKIGTNNGRDFYIDACVVSDESDEYVVGDCLFEGDGSDIIEIANDTFYLIDGPILKIFTTNLTNKKINKLKIDKIKENIVKKIREAL